MGSVKKSQTPPPEHDFKIDYFTHLDGHVDGCRHFDQGSCTCEGDKMTQELMRLRAELAANEIQIEALEITHSQARSEIARLRSMTKWQRDRMERIVVAPVQDV